MLVKSLQLWFRALIELAKVMIKKIKEPQLANSNARVVLAMAICSVLETSICSWPMNYILCVVRTVPIGSWGVLLMLRSIIQSASLNVDLETIIAKVDHAGSCHMLPPSLFGLFPFHVGYDKNSVLCVLQIGRTWPIFFCCTTLRKNSRIDLIWKQWDFIQTHGYLSYSSGSDQCFNHGLVAACSWWLLFWTYPPVHDHQILRVSVDASPSNGQPPTISHTRQDTNEQTQLAKNTATDQGEGLVKETPQMKPYIHRISYPSWWKYK